MMKLKVQQIFEATQVLATIINQKRALPTKGVYRVTRMHAKLFPEFTLINDQRTAKIASYDHKAFALPNGTLVPAEEAAAMGLVEQNVVPPEKMGEYVEWWSEMATDEVEVNIDPIPIEQLCIDGAESNITYAEFAVLGDLVVA